MPSEYNPGTYGQVKIDGSETAPRRAGYSNQPAVTVLGGGCAVISLITAESDGTAARWTAEGGGPVLEIPCPPMGDRKQECGDQGKYRRRHVVFASGEVSGVMRDFVRDIRRDAIRCQQQVEQCYRKKERWMSMSILNIAGMGKFSSDRTIKQYAEEIWGV